jgi:hypothetical protein
MASMRVLDGHSIDFTMEFLEEGNDQFGAK